MRIPTGKWEFHCAFDNQAGHVLCWNDADGNQIRILAHDFWAGRNIFSLASGERSGMIDWAGDVLDAEIARLRNAPTGTRAHQLFISAVKLHEAVASQQLSESSVTTALWEACRFNGLIQDCGSLMIEATLKIARRYASGC